jgi:N-acetylglucosaminyl-diphospho-decaprenol L-rhamnosyltransferase
MSDEARGRAEVDVLIVNYRTPGLTQEAVAAVSGGSRRTFVWDNSGELAAADLPEAMLLSNGDNILYAAASNRLYQQSDSPLVLLLNSDARCTGPDLQALVDALGEDRAYWGAAPRLVDEAGRDQDYRRRLPTTAMLLADRLPAGHRLLRGPWRRLYCRDLDPSAPGIVEQPAAACLLLRRAAVGPVLFDEAYPLFGNDLDLARRLSAAGSRCRYVPDVVVTHVGGASISTVGRGGRGWLRQQYDDALRLYARRHLRGWWLLEPLFRLRRSATLMQGGRAGPPAD